MKEYIFAVHERTPDAIGLSVGQIRRTCKELIRCKDCKHYKTDHFENFNGIPLIVAHEICMRWGDGCKTSPDGYCFMAERKEE